MKTILAKALFHSHSYLEYRKLVSDLLSEGKSTGNEQSEALFHYSSLNETRMSRLDKTMKVIPEIKAQLIGLKNEYIWLVLSEGWCGDAAQLLPVFNKMALESNNKIELKVVLRDENPELMDCFLTNTSKSIPKLIVINKNTGAFVFHWGPRPKGALDFIKKYKAEFGIIDEKAKSELQMWYFHDKGVSTQNEIMDRILKAENNLD